MSQTSTIKKTSSVPPWTIHTSWINSNSNKLLPTKQMAAANVDLLAVSCHLWTNYKHNSEKRFLDLNAASKTLPITKIDHDNAEIVADYFSKNILIKQLKDKVTPFELSVLQFIASNRLTYDQHRPGLIYRLPEYYENDQCLLKMKDEYFSNHEYIEIKSNYSVSIRQAKSIFKTYRNTSLQKVDIYWFIDVETDNPLAVMLDSKNKIKHIWDHMFDSGQLINIKGIWDNQSHALDFKYLSCNDWSIHFDQINQ
jgi:hypothetical protein